MAPRRSVVKGSGEVVIVQLTPKMREVYYIFTRRRYMDINGFFIDSFEWINMIGNDFQFFFLFFLS